MALGLSCQPLSIEPALARLGVLLVLFECVEAATTLQHIGEICILFTSSISGYSEYIPPTRDHTSHPNEISHITFTAPVAAYASSGHRLQYIKNHKYEEQTWQNIRMI